MKQILITNKRGVEAFQQEKYYEAIAIWHEALKIADADQTIINDANYASILFDKARAYEKYNGPNILDRKTRKMR